MRRLILLLFSVLLAHSGIAFGDLDDGLAAHYPFSGNANDVIGTHHGNVSGAVLTEDRFGNSNSAYSFDGVDDYINVDGSEDFSLISWSIAGWIYVNQYGQDYSSNIIRKLNNAAGHYNFAISYWPIEGEYQDAIGSSYEACNDEFDHTLFYNMVPLHEWVFFCSIRDDSTGRHGFYVNGSEIDRFWIEHSWLHTPCTTVEDLRIGCTFDVHTECFNGLIDDIRIYNRALSEAEIQQLYYEGGSLDQRIKELENRIKALEEAFENHFHHYQTLKTPAVTKEEADTGGPIIPE